MDSELKIRRKLAKAAPEHAAALLIKHAAQFVHDAGRILGSAAIGAGEATEESVSLYALQATAQSIEASLDALENELLGEETGP